MKTRLTCPEGNIEIGIGPTVHAGRENNWISTRPGEPIAASLRFYEPGKRIIEKQWVAGDLVEGYLKTVRFVDAEGDTKVLIEREYGNKT